MQPQRARVRVLERERLLLPQNACMGDVGARAVAAAALQTRRERVVSDRMPAEGKLLNLFQRVCVCVCVSSVVVGGACLHAWALHVGATGQAVTRQLEARVEPLICAIQPCVTHTSQPRARVPRVRSGQAAARAAAPAGCGGPGPRMWDTSTCSGGPPSCQCSATCTHREDKQQAA
jgi:hypothetical protein